MSTSTIPCKNYTNQKLYWELTLIQSVDNNLELKAGLKNK